MTRYPCRWAAAVLAALSLLIVSARSSAGGPVVLVPSSIGSAPAAWAEAGGKRTPTTLYDHLAQGLRPEQALFSLRRTQPPDETSFDIDVNSLRALLDRVRSINGMVPDIVAHGDGALVVRAAVGDRTDLARTVIAVSPPHRGSDSVHRLRMAHELENYLGLFTGTGRLSGPVAERAFSVWEPLYHEYVVTHLLSPDHAPGRFESWLLARHPSVVADLFERGQLRPGPGGIATAAYYDLLSLNAARYRYAYADHRQRSGVLRTLLRPLAWLVDQGAAALLDLLVEPLMDMGYRFSNWWTLRSKILGPVSVTDPAAERLTPETVSASGLSFAANGWLAALNSVPAHGVRWVSVVPVLGRGGSGDGLVDLEHGRAPLGPDDFFLSFAGPGVTDHHRVMQNRRLWAMIDRYRVEYPGAIQELITPGREPTTTAAITADVVQYVEYRADSRVGAVGADLEFEVRSPVPARAWVDLHRSDGTCVREELVPQGPQLVGSVDGFGPDIVRAVLGFRPRSGSEPVSCEVHVRQRPRPLTSQQESGDVPRIVVERSTKRTTLIDEQSRHHVRWEWEFGHGKPLVISGPEHAQIDLVHQFAGPGTYHVTATSYCSSGSVLRQQQWTEEVPEEPYVRTFRAASVPDPTVQVRIDGPREWICGRPARYRVTVTPDCPPGMISQTVAIDPAPEFEIQWPRPAVYDVTAAVIVTRRYRFDDNEFTIRHVSLHTVSVRVLATSLGD